MGDRHLIVVLDGHTLNPGDNPWDPVAALGELVVHDRTTADQVVARARQGSIVLTNKSPITAATLSELPALTFISVLATGYDSVDVADARRRDIPVSNVPFYGTDSVAQFTMALVLELCHHIQQHADAVRDGEWQRRLDYSFWDTPHIELAGKTMGIVGFGRIGRRVGCLANVLGMSVIAVTRSERDKPGYGPFAFVDTETAFARSDFLSLHLPLTSETQDLVNVSTLALMKPTAFLINTARGGLVVEQDLADALAGGQIAGAAVDVVSSEPIVAANPLLGAPNCLITPHQAWATLEARRRLMEATAANVRAFIEGSPINLVN